MKMIEDEEVWNIVLFKKFKKKKMVEVIFFVDSVGEFELVVVIKV